MTDLDFWFGDEPRSAENKEVHAQPPVTGWYVHNTKEYTYFGPFVSSRDVCLWFIESMSPGGPADAPYEEEVIGYFQVKDTTLSDLQTVTANQLRTGR